MNQPPNHQGPWGPPGPQGPGGPPPGGFGQPPGGFGAPPGGFGPPGYGPPGGPQPFGSYGYGGAPTYKPSKSSGAGIVIAIIAVISLLGIAVVGAGVYIAKKEISAPSAPTTPFASKDGKSEIRIPSEWARLNSLNDEAVIEVGNERREEYLIVISESKEDFSGMALDKYADLCVGGMKERVKLSRVSEPKKVTIEGKSGLQYEMEGTVDYVNIGYVVTFVDGDKNFHQIMAWTMKSQFNDKKQKLAEVTSTFRER